MSEGIPEKLRVRFAPSPTGYLHVGGSRTALYNWLFARHHRGTFILRIEDTDLGRSTEESAGAILQSMQWLGMEWDEGPYRQAERMDLYREHAQQLLAEGKAYYCICPPEQLEERRKAARAAGQSVKYDGRSRAACHPEGALRFRLPETGTTVVEDLIHGPVEFDNSDLDDFVIARSDGYPTYNFAAVVDDAAMGITHVIRGDDHLSNTPRQILLYQALGYPLPRFAHIPMILGPDRARLSKRHGATSISAYQEMGYLPEAMVNYLVRLGWSHGDQEIFSREEMIRYFSLEKVGKTPAVFDPQKLEWVNAHYIKTLSSSYLVGQVRPFWIRVGVSEEELSAASEAWLESVVDVMRERARTLLELAQTSRYFFQDPPGYDEKAQKALAPPVNSHQADLAEQIAGLSDFSAPALEAFYRRFAEDRGLKLAQVTQATRAALTGSTASPPLFQVMAILGKERVLRRLRLALSRTEQ
jgi:glutamyl-tRNA synthetase